ncbi:hypothetical protein [Sulfurimonas sp.]
MKKYPEPYIKESLEIVELKRRERIIKNIPAYTLIVLKNGYEPMKNTKGESLLSNSNRCQGEKTKQKIATRQVLKS